MQIFPTQYSLLSSSALRIKIQEAYGLKIDSCKLIIHNVSDTYLLIGQSEKYIFKIYRDSHRQLEEIRGEVELLNILVSKNAKVSFPIKDLNENQIQSFNAAEGLRYGVLYSFAKGKAYPLLSEPQLVTLGSEMAHIHNITSSIELNHFRKPYTIETTLHHPLKVLEPAFVNLPNQYDFLISTAAKVANEMADWDLSKFSQGYCHFDFCSKNFHYDDAGQITFFDFDFAGKGLLVNDILSFYAQSYLFVRLGMLTQQKAEEGFELFIEAYRKLRPISQDELNSLPNLGFAYSLFYLGFQYENYEDWSNTFWSDNYLKDKVKQIKVWSELNGIVDPVIH